MNPRREDPSQAFPRQLLETRNRHRRNRDRVATGLRGLGLLLLFLASFLLPAFIPTARALSFESADLVYRETFLGEFSFPLTPLVDLIGGGGIVTDASEVDGLPTGVMTLTGIEGRALIDAEGESFAEVSMNAANLGSQDVGLRIRFDDQSLVAAGPATLLAEAEIRFLDPTTLGATDVRGVVSIESGLDASLALEAESVDGSIDLREEIFLTSGEAGAILAGSGLLVDVFVDRANAAARVSIAIDGFALVASVPFPLDLGDAIALRAVGRARTLPFASGDHAELDLSLFEMYQPAIAPDDPQRPPQTIQFLSDGTLAVNGQSVTELNGTPFTSSTLPDATEFRFAGDLTLFETDTIVGHDLVSTTTPIRVYAGNDLTILEGALVDFSARSGSLPGPGGGPGGANRSGGSRPVAGAAGTRGRGPSGGSPVAGQGADINFTPGGLCVLTSLATNGQSGSAGTSGGDGHPGSTGLSGLSGGGGYGASGSGGGAGLRGAGGAGGVRGAAGLGATGGSAGASGAPPSNGPGGNGSAGTSGQAGTDGGDGQSGNPGLDGSNPAAGLVLSAGGGGGSGGQGGGGGAGGGGGGGGAGSAGGGAGAIQSSLLCVAGGDGGRGGVGGSGGGGGDGVAPGTSGAGGGGGGAIEFRARGRLIVAGSFEVEGSPGEPGEPGGYFPATCGEFMGFPVLCNYSGGTGSSGLSGTNGVSTGGDGRSGGSGGDGGAAGARGASGGGGDGAGGSVILYGSVVDQSRASVRAANGSGDPSGRYVIASNTADAGLGFVSGANVESLLGIDVPNPFVQSAIRTPTIAGLDGGAEGFGLMLGISALSSEFDAIRAAAPASATAAIVRLDLGPAGYEDDYLGYDMVVFLSLGDLLSGPRLGLDLDGIDTGFDRPLLIGGFANDPEFGGNGAQPLATLAPFQAYATLIPEITTPFVNGGALGIGGSGLLSPGQVVYVPEAEGGFRIALMIGAALAGLGRRAHRGVHER